MSFRFLKGSRYYIMYQNAQYTEKGTHIMPLNNLSRLLLGCDFTALPMVAKTLSAGVEILWAGPAQPC